jgi:imidazolonepropionase-like amidohydrolase
MRKQLIAVTIIATVFAGCTSRDKNVADKKVTVIKNVNFFNGEQYREGVNIVLRDGIITAIDTGDATSYNAGLTINATGKMVIPPLLNAHVHVWSESGLKEALAAGVFALFDMHGTDAAATYLRSFRDSAGYAYYYASGPGATVPGGHGTQLVYRFRLLIRPLYQNNSLKTG